MGTGVEEVAAAEAVKGTAEAAGAEAAMATGAEVAGSAAAAETAATAATAAGAAEGAGAWEAATAGMGEGMGSAAAASDFATATAGMGTGMGDAAAWEAATAGMGTGMGVGDAAAGAAGTTATSGTPGSFSPSANYGPGMTGAETSAYDTTVGLTGSPGLANTVSGAWGAVEPYVGTALKAANTALPYASLANSVMSQNRAGDRLAGINQNAGRTGEVANQLLSQYQTGQLSGADQQGIVQMKQEKLAQIDQYYQKAGLSNSSMHVQARAQVESQAETMRQQALDNTLKSGLSASGVSNQAALSAAQQGFAQDKQAGDALAEFMKVLGQMNTPQRAPTGTPGA
jgi:hypothetical protein